MNPFDALGDLWGSLKGRSRRFAAADEHPVQTHINHGLVIVLLFGTLGAGLSQFLGRELEQGLRYGIIIGWIFYVARELNQRLEVTEWLHGDVRGLRWLVIPCGFRFGWRDNLWDGVCDVLVPALIVAPVVFESIVILWALAAAVAFMYFVVRPLDDGGAR